MGLESISTTSLRGSEKGFNDPAKYAQVVERLHERGIILQGCFVFGMDQDTPEVFEKTARFAIDVGIDLPRFAVATPFPGTAFYKQLEAEGRILTRNWELYDGQHVVFEPARMSTDELQRGIEHTWRYTYRWRHIARRVLHAPSAPFLTLLTNLGYRRYAHRLDRFYTCDTPRLPRGPGAGVAIAAAKR